VALRYLIAEEHKEDGNAAFRRGDFDDAITCYTAAHKSEPRLPLYLLNRAMAELKVNRFFEAERDCSAVLRKHRTNPKALWRRAKARRAIAVSSGNIEKLIGAERGKSAELLLTTTIPAL
jgi:tetratricopeptide (TPR) repeat protein